MSLARLLICVIGVYSTFLLWAIAQERLSQPFPSIVTHHQPSPVSTHTTRHRTGTGDKIPSATVINVLQSLASCLSAVGYLVVKEYGRRRGGTSALTETEGSVKTTRTEAKGLWELIGWDELFGRAKGVGGSNVVTAEKTEVEAATGNDVTPSNGHAKGKNSTDAQGFSTALSVDNLNGNGHLTPRTYISSSTNTGSIPPSRSPSPFPQIRSSIHSPLSPISRTLLRPTPLSLLLRTSLLQTLTPLFAHASLNYISYPTLILGKSCKLLPVMGMNVLVYRRKFKAYKYVVVGMVSVGIGLFMACGGGKGKGGGQGDSMWGMGLLAMSLIIDGLTNSTQDELFSLYPHITGQALMFNMSFFSLCMTLPLVLLPPHLPATLVRVLTGLIPMDLLGDLGIDKTSSLLSQSAHQSPLFQTLSFICTHPTSLTPIIQFALLGGIGQLFIFETISHFGSLTLVMLTVTRKLVTMLLSVVIFGHELEFGQWAGVGVVFAGIGLEAGMKRKEIMDKKIAQEKQKSRLKAL